MGAGTEPQQNLIANALRLLLSDDRFAGDLSGGSLPVEDALDEVLWTDPPMANYAVRLPGRGRRLYGGVRLRAGDPVVDQLRRGQHRPRAGLASGARATGPTSRGARARTPARRRSPARLIASVAIEKLLDRLPDMRTRRARGRVGAGGPARSTARWPRCP